MIRKFDHLTKLDATDPMPMTLGPLVRDEPASEQWKRVSPVHRNDVFGDDVGWPAIIEGYKSSYSSARLAP
jgi:hypothetical protein